jgi:hypothetical protein
METILSALVAMSAAMLMVQAGLAKRRLARRERKAREGCRP